MWRSSSTSRHRSVHNLTHDLLAAMGAYCFFAHKAGSTMTLRFPESKRAACPLGLNTKLYK